jgi:MFS family permease
VALPWLAFLVVRLPAGALVDRVPQRPLLIGAALGRAAVLVAVPVLGAAGWLTPLTLYGAATAIGVLTVVAQVAARSYLPALVAREELMAGNTALTLGEGVAQVGGPAAGGALIQALGAPLALVADAGSALVAALLVHAMATPEPERLLLRATGIAGGQCGFTSEARDKGDAGFLPMCRGEGGQRGGTPREPGPTWD